MSHLGHRLSALIDDELTGAERDRALVHLARCDPCRSEAAALRLLKRRMSALGDAAADIALTRRLMGLAQQGARAGQHGAGQHGAGQHGPGPHSSSPASWPRFAAEPVGSGPWPQFRAGWYIGGGAVAVFLAGLGAAAFLVGGAQQVPGPRVTPSVDTYNLQHDIMTGLRPAGSAGPVQVESARRALERAMLRAGRSVRVPVSPVSPVPAAPHVRVPPAVTPLP